MSAVRLSMNELSTYRWTIDEDLHYYEKYGFDGIGVWRRKLNDFGVERGIELIAESGVAVSNLMWAGGFTGNDGRSQEESIADAMQAIELADAINARCLVLYTGGRNYHTRRHASRLIRSALEDLLPMAEARGVTLAVEPMHPACAGEWTLLTSLDTTLCLLEEYRSDALQLVLDTYHFPDASDDELAAIAPKTAVVHLADIVAPHSIDQQRSQIGEGHIELSRIMGTMVANGYQGFFDIELLGADTDPEDYEQLVLQASQRGAELLSGALPFASSSY